MTYVNDWCIQYTRIKQGASAYISTFVTLHAARCISRSGCLKCSISGTRDGFYYLPLINSSTMAFFGIRHGTYTRRGANFFLCPWYVSDMNTPDIHFNLQNTTFYYVCLSWFVLKMSCLFCTLEYMHWFTIINYIKQLPWLSLWLQSKLQILSNNNVALKNADYGWSWQLRLIFNRLYSLLLNHPSPSDHKFLRL